MNTKCYGIKATDVMLPRKVCTVINKKYLYYKPTQVGRYRIPRGAR